MLQISILKKYTAYLLVVLLFSHATAVFGDDLMYVIWRDIGLPDAVRLASQYSGKTIRLAHEAQGTISLASSDPVNSGQFFSLFEKSLQERGLVLLPGRDNTYQVTTAEAASADNAQPIKTEPQAPATQAAQLQHVGAIFASERRAADIAARLRSMGGAAEVRAPDHPADKEFSVVLLYRDSAEGYQAMLSAVERAGLNGLISTPEAPAAFLVQGKLSPD